MTAQEPDAMTPAAMAATHSAAFSQDRPWTASEFADLLHGPAALVTGTAHAFVLGRVTLDEAEILTLATAPAHQRRGLGRAALDTFIAAAAARGAARVFLDVAEDNAPALALYRAAGFAEIGRRRDYFARPGGAVTALVMARPCPRP